MKPGGVPAASLASASSSSRAPCLMSPSPANTPSPAPQDLSQTCRSMVNKVGGEQRMGVGGAGARRGECGGWGLGSGVQWFGIIVESVQRAVPRGGRHPPELRFRGVRCRVQKFGGGGCGGRGPDPGRRGGAAHPAGISPSSSDSTAPSPSSVSKAATSACSCVSSTASSVPLFEAEAAEGESVFARRMRALFHSSASVAGISWRLGGPHDRSMCTERCVRCRQRCRVDNAAGHHLATAPIRDVHLSIRENSPFEVWVPGV